MHLTSHAQDRAAQRGIPRDIVEAIAHFGTHHPAPRAARLVLDRQAISLAADGNTRRQARLERYSNAYVVIGDAGAVITVARQRRRFH